MYVTKNNQILDLEIIVYNKSTRNATGVTTVITLPRGVVYNSNSTSNGTFNKDTLTWTLDNLNANTAKSMILKVKVLDLSYLPAFVKQRVTANEIDINLSNNSKDTKIEINCDPCIPGTPSNPQVFLNDYVYSPILVNLSSFNTVKCGCCTAKYVLAPTTDNFSVDYFNSATGEVRGHQVDLTLSWSFDYMVQCLACPDGYQNEYGPKTVSGPASAISI